MGKITIFSNNVKEEYDKLNEEFPKLDVSNGIIPIEYLEENGYLEKFYQFLTKNEIENIKKKSGMTKEEILLALNEVEADYAYSNIYFYDFQNGKCDFEVLDMQTNDYLEIKGISSKEIEELKKYREKNITSEYYDFIFELLKRNNPDFVKIEINYDSIDFFPSFSKEAVNKGKNVELAMLRNNEMPFQSFQFKNGKLDSAIHFNVAGEEDIKLKFKNNNFEFELNENKNSGIQMELIENSEMISSEFSIQS